MFNTSDSFRIDIDQPYESQVFFDGDDIVIDGSIWGAIPKKVYAWDSKYNVPVLCFINSANRFGIRLYADDLSQGDHLICVQAQSSDGGWSTVETVMIEKKGGMTSSGTWFNDNVPEPFATIFRPVGDIISGIVVTVTGGTAPDDLNGDNIPDELQQSPAPPRYNPMNMPLSATISFGLIILVIIIIIVYVVRPYLNRKQMMEKALKKSPKYRTWKLQMQGLRNEKIRMKLRAEKEKRKKLEKKLAEEQKKTKTPVKIYLGDTGKKVQVKSKGDVATKKKGSLLSKLRWR